MGDRPAAGEPGQAAGGPAALPQHLAAGPLSATQQSVSLLYISQQGCRSQLRSNTRLQLLSPSRKITTNTARVCAAKSQSQQRYFYTVSGQLNVGLEQLLVYILQFFYPSLYLTKNLFHAQSSPASQAQFYGYVCPDAEEGSASDIALLSVQESDNECQTCLQ